MQKKLLLLMMVSLIIFTLLSGCAGQSNNKTWTPVAENTITIALMGNEENFKADAGFLPGIQMAIDEIQATSKVTVNVIQFDDGGEYDQGVGIANEVAANPTIAAAISVQDFEVIDTAASIFNEAKKPLIVTDGCYDETSAKPYEYLISDFISAYDMGRMLGIYAEKNDLHAVVSSHTDTQFEKDEIKGFQSVVAFSETRFVDLSVGPFTKDEFAGMYERWSALDADSIFITMYSYSLGAEIIKMVRAINPDITILTDYSINNMQTLTDYAADLDGTIIVPAYPVIESARLTEFNTTFANQFGFAATPVAAQSYDLVCLLADRILSGVATSQELMTKLKAPDGFAGVSGQIVFDSYGRLVVNNNQYLVCDGGTFVNLPE